METPELTAEQIDYLVLSSDKLATKYPELNARIQRAVSIVRAGGVQLRGDHAAAVANDGEAPYEVTDEGCTCEDFTHGNAPHGRCKHRLAVLLLTRTLEHFNGNPAPPASGPVTSEPAAPVEDLEATPVRKQQPPYVCPEPKYWVKGSRRTLNKAEKEIIDFSTRRPKPGARRPMRRCLRRCGAASSCCPATRRCRARTTCSCPCGVRT